MKKLLIILFALLFFSCSSSLPATEKTIPIKVELNGNVFNGFLYDNRSTRELMNSFPLALELQELNGNEKYAYMDRTYHTNSERIIEIREGDLMLYGSNCLVLFYESFSSVYSYTRLGHIDGDLSVIASDKKVSIKLNKE